MLQNNPPSANHSGYLGALGGNHFGISTLGQSHSGLQSAFFHQQLNNQSRMQEDMKRSHEKEIEHLKMDHDSRMREKQNKKEDRNSLKVEELEKSVKFLQDKDKERDL